MNFHPLLVHFPIAFFTLYSLFELARFPVFTKQSYYFPLKAILLFCGVLCSIPTIAAGLLIKGDFSDQNLVNLHETIQIIAVVIFSILALGYLIKWKNPPMEFLKNLSHVLIDTPVVFILTLLGLGAITAGSGLGGIIVYGHNLDPFTSLLASLLGIK